MNLKLFIPAFLLLILLPSFIFSQSNKIETIDFYGKGASRNKSGTCVPFHENDTISYLDDDEIYSSSVSKIESCLLKLPSVRQAEISFVCCTQPNNNWMVYIGMDSVAAPVKVENKTVDVRLPDSIIAQYNKLLDLLIPAIEQQQADEDDSQGHSLIKYAPAQTIQKGFITYANANLKLLRSVLHTSKHPEQREAAADIIAYHSNKKEIVKDLLESVTDSYAGVRNNAVRAIGVLAGYALKNPELNIQIDAGPFITLMNSISWTDRNKSSFVLLSLTQNRDPKIIDELKSKALSSIIDMAGWKNFGHSMPGYILLGRITGWSEQVIMSGVNNERKAQIQEMLDVINKAK